MPDDTEIKQKFWKALRSDMTVMLGLEGADALPPRPMTALLEGDEDHGPIWFFTSTDSHLVTEAHGPGGAMFTFADKGHNVFATVHGMLARTDDRAVIDRLWNPHVAAWYEGGKDDPKLALLRFDPAKAELWLDGSSLVAGVMALFGKDPQEDYKDNAAKVSLS